MTKHWQTLLVTTKELSWLFPPAYMFCKAWSKGTWLYHSFLLLEVYAQQQITYSQQQQGTYSLITIAEQTGAVLSPTSVQ